MKIYEVKLIKSTNEKANVDSKLEHVYGELQDCMDGNLGFRDLKLKITDLLDKGCKIVNAYKKQPTPGKKGQAGVRTDDLELKLMAENKELKRKLSLLEHQFKIKIGRMSALHSTQTAH